MKQKVLAAEGLIKLYSGKRTVDRISLSVETGEIAALLGPNGAGKTTLFYMLAGLTRPDGGKVLLDGTDITSLPLASRARLGISYLPQERSIFRGLSVEKNVSAVLEMQSLHYAEVRRRTSELMSELGLEAISDTLGSKLSGGEARRLEIARALALKPDFILMDEPFAGVDPIAVGAIQEIISRLSSQGIGVLISDHNVRETLGICQRAFVINLGKLLTSGAPEEIAQDKRVRSFYLGQNFQLGSSER